MLLSPFSTPPTKYLALMSDLRTMFKQEQDLEDLGIEQSMRVDLAGLVEAPCVMA